MKLWNVLSVALLGSLFAVGCTVTSTDSTDGGTSGDSSTTTDTGSGDSAVKDTGTAATDTGTATDAAGACAACQTSKCSSELTACQDSTAYPGCKSLFDCIGACSDAACQNTCVTNSKSAEGKALVNCILTECSAECTK